MRYAVNDKMHSKHYTRYMYYLFRNFLKFKKMHFYFCLRSVIDDNEDLIRRTIQ